jgi:antibiotic biosynthesis monooxygenase (ABM) superfamily enzyme
MSTSHVRRITGLETWFEVPGRTAPAPPRWKMFVVTSVVIFVLQLMLNLVLYRFAPPIALVPRVAFISFSVSALMTWVVQPRLALLLERWLYAPRRSR